MVADGEHLNQSSYAFARSTATALRRRLGSSLVVPAQADRSPRSCIKAARAPRAFTRRFTPAFTIVELLVVISIVTILASFLMPAFARVREAADRLQCSNNMRQIGCAIMSYADDNNDRVPAMQCITGEPNHRFFGNAMALTTGSGEKLDGLGVLLSSALGGGYVSDPRIFYCPCHCGDHPFERYSKTLLSPTPQSLLGEPTFSNYHYRGTPDNGADEGVIPVNARVTLGKFKPNQTLLADGMRTRADFNHVKGTNRLFSDGHTDWHTDSGQIILRALPQESDSSAPNELWSQIDSDGYVR
ncbi:MAG: type II secretion system protein [Planctomycetota bacterium]|nr:MAG: type II secretion system protein [Planctomycetota bacterium]RLS92715.1 MAG: type II secretion system protein [Planctomycetota bacterium]